MAKSITLLAESALASGHELLVYHRRGYAGSTHAAGALTVAQHAADCRALLRHLGIERTHVVGHSYGSAVALQLALDSPELIESLALSSAAKRIWMHYRRVRNALDERAPKS
jgi:3-oxoadipate enol-lactonase